MFSVEQTALLIPQISPYATINDGVYHVLDESGYAGTINEKLYALWVDQGYTGSFTDMFHQWTLDGSVLSGQATFPVIASTLGVYEFDRSGTITVDENDKVTHWGDFQQGLGVQDFTQSTESQRPTLVSGGLDWGSSASNSLSISTPSWGTDSAYEIWWVMESDDPAQSTWGNFTDFLGGASQNVDRLTAVSNGFWSKPTGSTVYQNNVANEAWLPYNTSSFSITATTAIPFNMFGNRDNNDRGVVGKLKGLYVFGGSSSSDVPTSEERIELQSYLEGRFGTLS